MSRDFQTDPQVVKGPEETNGGLSHLVPKVQSKIQPKVYSKVQPKLMSMVSKTKEQTPEISDSKKLPEGIQDKMKSSFGQDFSGVNVHTNSSSAETINAKAYTQGNDIHFAPGEYEPFSKSGQELIGHELAHVVQQRQGKVGSEEVYGKGVEINQDVKLEKEADEARKLVSEGKSVTNLSYSEQSIQMKPTGNPPLSSPFFYSETDYININFDNGYYLRRGATGTAVYRLQEALVALRATPSDFKVDGIFGIETYKAVIKFQYTVGFRGDDLDGIVGSKTLGKMDVLLAGQAPPVREEESSYWRTSPFPIFGKQSFTPANTNVSPSVAFNILENLSRGKYPFKPEKGKGGASWFVTEGNPYVGIDAAKNITVPVEIESKSPRITFRESQLLRIFQEELLSTKNEAELKYREYNKIPPETPLSNTQQKGFKRFHERFAESRMWDRVGKIVSSSAEKAGEVILEPGSKFSKTPGKFAVISDASKIRIKGGIEALITLLERNGLKAEPAVSEAAAAMASKMKWAGRVRATFQYGGRVLIVLGIAADSYKIYTAQNKVKAIVEVAGGWTGATIAASAFATWFAPADVAGPWAWAAHGVGTLLAGGVGYWVGSSTTKTIYELVLED